MFLKNKFNLSHQNICMSPRIPLGGFTIIICGPQNAFRHFPIKSHVQTIFEKVKSMFGVEKNLIGEKGVDNSYHLV